MPAAHRPTVRGRRLASELRKLRERTGFTCDEVAKRLGWSGAKISRMETARVRITEPDLRDLLELYGVPEYQWAALIKLAKEATLKGWWHAYGDVLPKWFEGYIGLEAEASKISTYNCQLVPGLLQTPDYARTLLRTYPTPDTPEEIERGVEIRMNRQRLLSREQDPMRFAVVLDEAVLRRPIGDSSVMREQLEKLLVAAEQPNIDIQVLPFAAGVHEAVTGTFNLLEFPDPSMNKVVYLDNLVGGLYLEKTPEIGRYTMTFQRLREKSLDQMASLRCIKNTAREL